MAMFVTNSIDEEQLRAIIIETVKNDLLLGSDDTASDRNHYLGKPTNAHLKKIQALLNDASTSVEDWFVCCVRASNDLINHEHWRWHKNILKQMSKTSVGCSFLLNHNWSNVDCSVGFIYDGELEFVPQAEALKMKACKINELNKQIVKQQGGCTVYKCWVAIAASQNAVSLGIKEGRLNDVSTGGILNKPQYICPVCSEKHGRDVDWNEQDKNKNYICPHALTGWGWLFDEEAVEMPYYVKNGNYVQVETSFVNTPNYVDCGVVR